MKRKLNTKQVEIVNKIDSRTYKVVERKLKQHEYVNKTIKQTKYFIVDADIDALNIGDIVNIFYSKPQSKKKAWKILNKVDG